MSLSLYIEDIKSQLSVGDNPAPVVDGPVSFALNSQNEKTFISVSETSIGYEPSDAVNVYMMPIDLEIGIHVERAATDRTNFHLKRARGIFDDVWTILGVMKSGGFQIIRTDAERQDTDDASAVTYIIRATLHARKKDGSC